ncbi:MAG: hypothetical protein NVSMB57_05850 [Actinomycetota bacterium]
MGRTLRTVAIVSVLALGASVPANSQPLTIAGGAYQSANAFFYTTNLVNNVSVSSSGGNLWIFSQVTADNVSGNVTPTANFVAAATSYTCSYPSYTCTGWNAPQQIVSATAFQMDPIGNSATFRASLVDTASQSHTINVTLSRPTSTQVANSFANVWVDGQSSQVATPFLGLSRSGYVLSGTFGNQTPVNAPCTANGTCGGSTGSTITAAQPASAQVN